jgi:hypothetical protein
VRRPIKCWPRCLAPIAVSFILCAASSSAAPPRVAKHQQATEARRPEVEVLDRSFDVAGSMLAYTEFELSGEPLVENLGLDLDVLDPNFLMQPTPFDYAAGIESYEYSEEAMYALLLQSRLGPHLANGPTNGDRGGQLANLGQRFVELTQATGFSADELPLNLYPISIPYSRGEPEFEMAVNIETIGNDTVEVTNRQGEPGTLRTDTPAYLRDFQTLGWKESGMTRNLVPAALGATLLKEVMWSQDFLGGMHTVPGDEEVDATTSLMDQDGSHALGVSAVDGVNGAILTEISWDKLRILRDDLGYDGKNLGAVFGPTYDVKAPIWFPRSIAVEEKMRNGVKAIGGLTVVDSASSLRDTWMLLWSVSEFYAFCDQRTQNANQNPAFRAVFDGAPFPSAPKNNLDDNDANNTRANDPFSLASDLSNLLFRNLESLHFDSKAGTSLDVYAGSGSGSRKPKRIITTLDAAYSIVALSVYQRAQDALPVGYASASATKGLETARGKRALQLIELQADFIISRLIGHDGLAIEALGVDPNPDIEKSPPVVHTLATQFAVIRGLTRAFIATGQTRFRDTARALYLAVEEKMYDRALGTFADSPGEPTIHTPWTAAAISGGLRELLLHLANDETETNANLERGHLVKRYVDWFHGIINGRAVGEGMQLAEWLGDSGENRLAKSDNRDNDRDGVPQITEASADHGTAMVMASRVQVSAER